MSAKEILVSVVLSAIVVSGLGFVALPIAYQTLQESGTVPDHEHDPPGNLGIVLQSLYKEFSTQAGIFDDNNDSWINIPDTSLNITIKSQSRISAIFSTPYIIGIGDTVTGERVEFNISLGVEGVGNITMRVAAWHVGPTSEYREIASSLYIQFVTGPLPSGTYTIKTKYISNRELTGSNLGYLTLNVPQANYTRSLWVSELRS